MNIVGSFFKLRELSESKKKESRLPTLSVGNVLVTCPKESDDAPRFREIPCNVYSNKKEYMEKFNDTFYDNEGVAKSADGFTFQNLPNFDIHVLTPYMGKTYEVTNVEEYSRTTAAGVTYNGFHKYELKEIKL